jgi:hypothetical protein
MSDDRTLQLIEEQAERTIRRVEIDGVWYFSIIDVVAVLTGSPQPRRYWADMKRDITDEGFTQLYARSVQLKLPSRDGKNYKTDAADLATMLRIVQSIKSPKAEPIKQWLARIGARNLEETYSPASLGSSIAEIKQHKPDDDDLLGMADYYQQLSMVYRRQAHLESRLRLVEVASQSHDKEITDMKIRLDELERNLSSLPDLLQLLRVELLTPTHQKMVRHWVNELARLTGWHISKIFTDLAADFEYKTFSDARESDWDRITTYFQQNLQNARKRQ